MLPSAEACHVLVEARGNADAGREDPREIALIAEARLRGHFSWGDALLEQLFGRIDTNIGKVLMRRDTFFAHKASQQGRFAQSASCAEIVQKNMLCVHGLEVVASPLDLFPAGGNAVGRSIRIAGKGKLKQIAEDFLSAQDTFPLGNGSVEQAQV